MAPSSPYSCSDQLAVFRHEPDLLDQAPNTLCGLRTGLLVIEGFPEGGDFLPVYLGKVGVQPGHRSGRRFQLSVKIAPPGLQGRHLILHRRARYPPFDGLDEPAKFALSLFQVVRDAVSAHVLFSRLPI